MNPIDTAVNEVLADLGGHWYLVRVEPTGTHQITGSDNEYVSTLAATIKHDELGATITGTGATLGNALADAVRRILAIEQEVSRAP